MAITATPRLPAPVRLSCTLGRRRRCLHGGRHTGLANRSPGVPRYPKRTILKRKVDARSRDPAPPRAHTPHDTPQWECMQTLNRFFCAGKRIHICFVEEFEVPHQQAVCVALFLARSNSQARAAGPGSAGDGQQLPRWVHLGYSRTERTHIST